MSRCSNCHKSFCTLSFYDATSMVLISWRLINWILRYRPCHTAWHHVTQFITLNSTFSLQIPKSIEIMRLKVHIQSNIWFSKSLHGLRYDGRDTCHAVQNRIKPICTPSYYNSASMVSFSWRLVNWILRRYWPCHVVWHYVT